MSVAAAPLPSPAVVNRPEARGRSIAMRAWLRRAVAVLDVGLCLAMVVSAASLLGGYFGAAAKLTGLGWLVWLALAAVVGAVVAVVGARRPGPLAPALAVVGAVFALVLVEVYGLFPHSTTAGLPGPGALGTVMSAIGHGLPRMLSVTVPADAAPELLALPVAVCLLAAFAAVWLSRRTQGSLTPAAPGLAVFIGALMVTGHATAPHRWPIVAVFVSSVLLLALVRADRALLAPANDQAAEDTGRHTGSESTTTSADPSESSALARIGAIAPTVALVVVVGLAGLAVAALQPVVTGTSRFDLRDWFAPPVSVVQDVTPLATVREQLVVKPPEPVFSVRVESAVPLTRLRVAALDSFDGAVWTAPESFSRTGTTLPSPAQGLTGGRAVTMHVDVSGLPGAFLPEVGQPRTAGGATLVVQPSSGTLAVPSARSADGVSYVVHAMVTTPGEDVLRSARPAAGIATARYRALTVAPPLALQNWARSVTVRSGNPYDQLAALATALRAVPYDPQAKPGQSYGAMTRVLVSQPADRRGYAEQTASAFAAMARYLGFPTRVAVGYLLDAKTLRQPGGTTYDVTTAQADAWPEVLFDHYGWVAFDVTGTRRAAVVAPPKAPTTQAGKVPNRVRAAPAATSPRLDPGAVGGEGGGTLGRRIALWSLTPLLLALLALGGVVLAKRLRRSRRRQGETRAQIAGAWLESLDRLREHGLKVPTAWTPAETGATVTTRFDPASGELVEQLAPLVSAAVYAPGDPVDDDVTQAWDAERALARALAARSPAYRRVVTLVDPRPLLPAGLR